MLASHTSRARQSNSLVLAEQASEVIADVVPQASDNIKVQAFELQLRKGPGRHNLIMQPAHRHQYTIPNLPAGALSRSGATSRQKLAPYRNALLTIGVRPALLDIVDKVVGVVRLELVLINKRSHGTERVLVGLNELGHAAQNRLRKTSLDAHFLDSLRSRQASTIGR